MRFKSPVFELRIGESTYYVVSGKKHTLIHNLRTARIAYDGLRQTRRRYHHEMGYWFKRPPFHPIYGFVDLVRKIQKTAEPEKL